MNINSQKFRAFLVSEKPDGGFQHEITEKYISDLPAGEVVIRVHYSSLNYKDGLSSTGNKAVTRKYPHIPGIDAAGIVASSSTDEWKAGDQVVVTGFDLGMNTSGGFGEYIRVPAKWVVKLPEGLTLKQSMIYGTAGFTAGLSVAALIHENIRPEAGPIAVTGATGGVGSVTIAILSKLGYEVIAVSSKESAQAFLRKIGATSIIPRNEVEDAGAKILLTPRFSAAVDTVGGRVLANIVKSLKYGGTVTTCGMVNGGDLPLTVFPFILRGVKLFGIDSVELPMEDRLPVWDKLGKEWRPDNIDSLAHEISLEELPAAINKILHGEMEGRAVVSLL